MHSESDDTLRGRVTSCIWNSRFATAIVLLSPLSYNRWSVLLQECIDETASVTCERILFRVMMHKSSSPRIYIRSSFLKRQYYLGIKFRYEFCHFSIQCYPSRTKFCVKSSRPHFRKVIVFIISGSIICNECRFCLFSTCQDKGQ